MTKWEKQVEDSVRIRDAAPELLAAAIRVRARCQKMRFDNDAAKALDDLDAAIALAKGEP